MQSSTSQRFEGLFSLAILCIVTIVLSVGCSKDSGPTGPYDPPSYPNLIGHWTGTGSWWDSYDIRVNWVADITQQSDSTFSGSMTDTYTAPSSMSNYSLRWTFSGSVTTSGRVVIRETARNIVYWPISTLYLPAMKTYASCSATKGADTLTYSGPGPQPSATPETFVLVKQK
jgi:hypothetical protein